ncbi:MAG: bifunctional UDP-N-acetylmuramoyl-tripeptide:D-alanyl-D-alanine ligase/alanine racemase [Chitinophagaceae bacterium]
MKPFVVNDILSITAVEKIGVSSNVEIQHLLIDSRKLVSPDNTIFFAIKTSTNDGHHFIEELYLKGVRFFVVSQLPEIVKFHDATFYDAENVIAVLQTIAAFHRKQFVYPVIGITGSNGKTIVKEWLYHLLQPFFDIVRSPRSFNSQIGVPLSVWQMRESNELAIFEAGISLKGEMKRLQEIIQPTIGLITNLGEAHAEGFLDEEEKLLEKLQLFSAVEVLVYCKDHLIIDKNVEKLASSNKNLRTLTWGRHNNATIVLKDIKSQQHTTSLCVEYNHHIFNIEIPFVDQIAIENAMHCFALSVALNVSEKVIERMKDLPSLAMRLEMKEGQQNSILINDSYNADLTGVLSAIDFLAGQKSGMQKTAILSDISGLSNNIENTYRNLATFLHSKKIKTLYAVGSQFVSFASFFQSSGLECFIFISTDELINHIHPGFFKDQLVLIKGARNFHFERISKVLETKLHKTRLEVNLSTITQNLKQYRSRIQPSVKLMAMVKAFSYGAGSFEIASLLQHNRVDYIAVAYVDEGVELRRAGIHIPIMVMNAEEDGFPSLVEYDLEPEVFSIEHAKKLSAFIEKEGIQYFPIHLKIDTGMHRLGLDEIQVDDFLEHFSGNRFLLKSVFTHLVASEDPLQDNFTKEQLSVFNNIFQKIQSAFSYRIIRHASNTAAIIRHPEATYEMVRLGIGLYGVTSYNENISLTEAVELKTTIAQLRRVKKGESVGYGRGTILENDTTVATIRIGYADGFPRTLGNGQGQVTIRGRQYPTIGNVCMDMTMIDIGDDDQIQIDEEVLIFGKDYSVKIFAKKALTIPYEIMTGISGRVPRIYLSE